MAMISLEFYYNTKTFVRAQQNKSIQNDDTLYNVTWQMIISYFLLSFIIAYLRRWDPFNQQSVNKTV